MASCLGLYIEDNIIKYAKVSKDNDIIKIDSFGIKFYDKLEEAIDQVIAETYSYKTPISINSTNENYNYFYIFNLLNKKDIQSYVKTEFESICYENEQNVDVFETRYVLVDDLNDKEKIKAIHISTNKGELERRINILGKYKLTTVTPLAFDLSNLLEVKNIGKAENIAIVNIEDSTTVTTIIDQKIYNIDKIEEGVEAILNKINSKENSYAKAYEICKNSTIYTSEGKELQYEENAYLDDIMPTLYNIVGKVRKILFDSLNKIDKVYITGTAAVINNIDIYFQEYLEDIKCEILRPYFIHAVGTDINIKDYIEVNSAIAIALQGLGEGIRGINFRKNTLTDKLPSWLTIEVGSGKPGKTSEMLEKLNFKFDFKDALTLVEKNLIRGAIAILLIILMYVAFSMIITSQIEDKREEVVASVMDLQTQLSLINNDTTMAKTKTVEYQRLIQNLEEQSKADSENKRLKYAIPTLLNKIMYTIPVNVQITEISNEETTTETGDLKNKITIIARSNRIEQISLFIEKLENDVILKNVVNDTSQNINGVVEVKIEGELP